MDLLLSLSIKYMNEKISSDVLVPYLLLFGVSPILRYTRTTVHIRQDTINSLLMACTEMQTIVSNHRIQKSISSKVHFSSNHEFITVEKVLVYRRKSNLKFFVPYSIRRTE